MKKSLFVLGMTATFALTGCHGLKKVEFAKYKEAVEAVEVPKVTQVKVSGKYDGKKVNYTYEIKESLLSKVFDAASLAFDGEVSDENKMAVSIALGNKTPMLVESDKLEYYTGFGFKVKGEEGVAEWDGKGLLAMTESTNKDLSYKLNVSWKKA